MIDLIKEAENLQRLCEFNDWDFCFIGGLALQFWGEPRLRQDIDLTLLTRFVNESVFIETLLLNYLPRIENAADFAQRNRILLLKNPNNIGIDISLGGLPFEEEMTRRASYQTYLEDVKLKIITAEDLIVMKATASRTKDWLDVETVLIRQQNLDWQYIEYHLAQFVEVLNKPEIITKLTDLRNKFYQR